MGFDAVYALDEDKAGVIVLHLRGYFERCEVCRVEVSAWDGSSGGGDSSAFGATQVGLLKVGSEEGRAELHQGGEDSGAALWYTLCLALRIRL